jgi:hypothetical protein
MSAARRLTADIGAPSRLVPHDDRGRKTAIAYTIDAANEGVHPRPVLVVHLRGLTRLREGIRFIHQQSGGAACFAGRAPTRVHIRAYGRFTTKA